VRAAYEAVRALVPTLDADRPPAPDIARLATALRAGLLEELEPEAE
jgi:histidine ammonia-lyase